MPISAAVRCVLYSASLTHRAGGCYPPLRSSGYNKAFVGTAICRLLLHTYAQKKSLADEARLLFALLLLFQHQGGDGAGREGKGIGGGAAVCLCQVVVFVGHIGGVAGVTVQRQGGAAGLIRVVDEHGGNVPLGFLNATDCTSLSSFGRVMEMRTLPSSVNLEKLPSTHSRLEVST